MGREIWREGSVAVWMSSADDPVMDAGFRMESLLCEEEKSRARRFRSPRDRLDYERAHAALRIRLSQLTGKPPGDLAFKRGPWGKPELVENCDTRFNLSYRREVALVGSSRALDVGVDVETLEGFQDPVGTAIEIMTHREYRDWTALESSSRSKALLHCWTRKEAVVKAIGAGLSLNPGTFSAGLRGARMLTDVLMHGSALTVEVHSFTVGPRHIGAVAFLRGQPAVAFGRADR